MPEFSKTNSWSKKFANAFRGIGVGIQGQNSFYVHLSIGLMVIVAALMLGFDTTRLCLLLLCIAFVLTAELINSSLERFAKAITTEHDPQIRDGLDIASGAVLVAAIFAAVTGAIIFLSS